MPPTAQDRTPQPASPTGGKPLFFSPLVTASLWTAAAIVILGVGAIPWLASDPGRLTRLIARAVPGLEADVAIGRAQIGWSGPIVIEDVRVVPRNAARPPLSIRRIEGNHGLLAMLLSGGDLGTLRIEGLEADVVFDTDRTSNLTGLLTPATNTGGSRVEAAPRRSPVRLRLEIEDAIARISGPWAAEPWVSEPTDVKVALGPLPDGSASAWTIDRVDLLRDATLEANVAQGVLAYIAPVLADATRTSGRFSLRLDGARLPVGQPAAGELAGVLSMHEVVVGPGPLVEGMFRSLPGQLPPPPTIRVADESHVSFRLAERRVWHDGLEFGVPLAKPGQRLDVRSQGSVGLDDRSLDLKLTLPIPADLPQDKPLLAALAGKTVSLGVGGSLGQPRINFDGSIKAAAGQVVTDLIDRLRDGPKPQPDANAQFPSERRREIPRDDEAQEDGAAASPAARSADDTTEAIIDIVGGVLDEVAKRRAERRAAEAANPDAAPPRRGRLRDRLLGPAPATGQAPPPNPAPAP